MTPNDMATPQLMSVINRGQDAFHVVVQKRDFVAQPDGSLNYQEAAPYGAANWLTVRPTQFTLAPGKTQVVTADFDVPADPDVGDHQVAVVFLVPAGKVGGNIKVNRGVAMPAFLTVAGPVDDTVQLTGLTGPSWSIVGKPDITASLRNVGSVHRDFRGTTPLNLTSAGKTTRFPDFTVPRDSTRNITTSWHPPLVCICHPMVTFSNTRGPVQSATIRIIVFPWWLAAALLLFGLGVGLMAGLRRRRRRRTSVAPAVGPAAVSSGGA